MYLSIEELATKLGRTKRQIQYAIKQGTVRPVNLDTYRRDGGYRFTLEEFERLKELHTDNRLSLKQAAEMVGITPQYLNSLTRQGIIESELVQIGEQQVRKFEEEACIKLKEDLDARIHTKRSANYGKKLQAYKNNVRLFEKFVYQGELVRVVDTAPIKLLKEDGQILSVKDIDLQQPKWNDVPYIRKRGFIEFIVPIPRHMEHQTYTTLYHMLEQVGEKNLQIYERKAGDYMIRCRQMEFTGTENDFLLLNMYLQSGSIEYQEGIISLRTGIVSKTFYFPEEMLSALEDQSKKRGKNLQEFVIDLLKNELNNRKL
ncbi:helix-turn-helix domain-containing protein [Bacillus sp. SCS-151]|uniref:helix-turn-helix domain-containing protein n=1 Tax=Nanhaiella sioensis TaxID=3115293 RepID=UPI00397E44D4